MGLYVPERYGGQGLSQTGYARVFEAIVPYLILLSCALLAARPLLDRLGYRAPPYAAARSTTEALERSERVGFPLLVRPSYVLGGRAMEIVYSVEGLRDYLKRAAPQSGSTIYLDRFLEDSIEVDVDALADGRDVWIAGIMQHVEEAGIHSGDSACVLPPHSLGEEMLAQIAAQTEAIAIELGVVGLLNVQFAIHGEEGLHVIEANPRASRTVPFVANGMRQICARHVVCIGFSCGVNIQNVNGIRVREGNGKFFQEIVRATVCVWLKDGTYGPTEASLYGIQVGSNFGRVVSVVIQHQHTGRAGVHRRGARGKASA